MIKNFIFDIGGVLLDFNPKKIISAYIPNTEDIDDIIHIVFQSDIWAEFDRGVVSEEDIISFAKDRMKPRLHTALEKLFRNWYKYFVEIVGAYDFVKKIKEKGYNIFILSNINDKFYVIKKEFPVLGLFENYVLSCEVHINKPDKRIYQALLQKYELIPEECLFIDDKESNVLAAKELGIEALVFRSYEDAVLQKYVNE